ncbi:MAG: helix-turn-helix domain-containing protein [Deltaproteobacteria bacterium]|nr:helix-turn-helix domain-containing protein [Deltaproteobacteria bacterium]
MGPRRFTAQLPALRCPRCGEVYLPGPAVGAFDDAVTRALVEAGASDGDALRWLRRAAGLRAADLAALLDVRPETVSRWETEASPAPRAAVYALGTLALASVYGQTAPLERLRALASPTAAPEGAVALDVRAA